MELTNQQVARLKLLTAKHKGPRKSERRRQVDTMLLHAWKTHDKYSVNRLSILLLSLGK